MGFEDLRIQHKEFGNRLLHSVKIVFAFLCALTLVWEFGSTPYGQGITEGEKGIIDTLDCFIIAVFLTKNILLALFSQNIGEHIRRNAVESFLSILLVLFLFTGAREQWHYFLVAVKVFALFAYPYRVLADTLSKIRVNTPLTVAFSFLTIIIVGMLLLMLPKSTVAGSIYAVDALFTATSATCVTGLIVVDTGTYFSPFGQAVLLCLIQVGGLGLMTFMAFFSLALGRGLGIRQEVVVRDALSLQNRFGLHRVVVFILVSTFVVEAIGAGALYLTFPFPAAYTVGQQMWFSVFHSVSAFCNSGFSLLSSSLMGARSYIPLNLVMAGLIVIGGLGFVVNYNILSFFRGLLKKKGKFTVVPKEPGLERLRRFGLQTKVVLITTIFLLAAGTFLVYLLEASRSFASFPEGDKWMASFFQSVTARTAGFNTVRTAALATPTLLLVIMLMFIGASPGSTGGGVKTSTFAMFLLAVSSRLRNRRHVEIFKRTIPQAVIFNGVVVVVVSLCVVLASTMVLTITEKDGNFIGMLFEVVSAFGTVGLSTGVTSTLSVAGKVAIIVTMFVGRIGPLTLMLAMSGQEASRRYEYPDESVMVG